MKKGILTKKIAKGDATYFLTITYCPGADFTLWENSLRAAHGFQQKSDNVHYFCTQ